MKRAKTGGIRIDARLPSTKGGPLRALPMFFAAVLLASCGGGPKTDPRYPPRPEGCDVKVFRGKIAGITYDDIGHVDAICGNDIGPEECLKELKNQTCKLGGDLVYDVPDEPLKPSPDKISYTGRVAHTRALGAGKAPR